MFRLPLLLLCLVLPAAAEEPTLLRIFHDGVVLQREEPIEIKGFRAEVGADVKVRLGDEEVAAEADGKRGGMWIATFPAREASSVPLQLQVFHNGDLLHNVEDVLIGDVWLAAGQSNMAFGVAGMVKNLPETQSWVDTSELPQIRLLSVKTPVLPTPDMQHAEIPADSTWRSMTPDTVLKFSAVGASFACAYHEKQNVPVGVIDVSWGGKPIEPFIPLESFDGFPLSQILEHTQRGDLEAAKNLNGGVIIRNPEGMPGMIYNARIAPLTHIAVRGFLWYQAESNAGRGENPIWYRKKMEALANGWRDAWDDRGKNELPLYFVQLPAYPPATGWIRMREEQRMASIAIQNCEMATIFDLPGDDIHPPTKIPVGERLAYLATGGKPGPIYQTHERRDGGLMIQFHPDSSPPKPIEGQITGFEVAGDDAKWISAAAEFRNGELVVSSPEVPNPRYVRYQCATEPIGELIFGENGIPASPFCSNIDQLPWTDQE